MQNNGNMVGDPDKPMTAAQLILELQKLPPDATVGYVWDGCRRTEVYFSWADGNGLFSLCHTGETLCNVSDCPAGYVLDVDERYWTTPAPEFDDYAD